MARAGASKSLDKPAPKARGADQGRQVKLPSASKAAAPAPVKRVAKAVRKKNEPAAVPPKPAAKAAKAAKKPASKAAVKATKAPASAKAVKTAKPVAKAVKRAPAKAVKATKAKAAPVAKSVRTRQSARGRTPNPRPTEVAQVAEPKGKRAATATKAPAKAVPAAAPVKPEASANFPAKTLDKLRRLLEEERETYVRQARDLAAEAEALAAEREPGDTQFDEESGEGDTLNVERERDLALSASATQAVEDIDRALFRMDTGAYGVCERCGKKIAVARLEALPFAALCIECKSREERRR
jgi:RNA polymerase-binding transcription factor DksA